MIPDHIARHITEANRVPRRTTPQSRPVARGDVRRLQNLSNPRLVLVLAVDTGTQTAQYTLLHSYTEFATEADVIVTPALSALPYDLVVQTDLRGVISTKEINDLIAVLPERIVRACFAVPAAFESDETAFSGPAQPGLLDALWDFKIAEGNTIRDLSSAAFEMLTKESILWQFKFRELLKALLEPVPDSIDLVEAMQDRWNRGRDLHVSTPDAIADLEEHGLLDRRTWIAKLPVIGALFYDSVLQQFFQQCISASNNQPGAPERHIGLIELRLQPA